MVSSCATFGQAEEVRPLRSVGRTTQRVLLYLPNRFMDFLDIFRANMGVGPGWGANFRATEYFTAGASDYDTIRFGMRGRQMPRYEEMVREAAFGLFGYQTGYFDREPFEVAATAHAACLGFELGFDLDEAGDFILGFGCMDYKEDDLGPRSR